VVSEREKSQAWLFDSVRGKMSERIRGSFGRGILLLFFFRQWLGQCQSGKREGKKKGGGGLAASHVARFQSSAPRKRPVWFDSREILELQIGTGVRPSDLWFKLKVTCYLTLWTQAAQSTSTAHTPC
jgi:hypothetical protein